MASYNVTNNSNLKGIRPVKGDEFIAQDDMLFFILDWNTQLLISNYQCYLKLTYISPFKWWNPITWKRTYKFTAVGYGWKN